MWRGRPRPRYFTRAPIYLFSQLLQFFFRLHQQAVANLRHPLQIALALFRLLFDLELFDLFLQRARAGDQVFLLFPVGFQRVGLLPQFCQLLFDHRQPFFGVRVAFFLQRLLLDFELRGAALQLVDFCGHGIDLDAQRCRSFVDQVDGFVGQEAVRNIAMRQRGRGHNGGILDADAVMHFVALFQSAKDRNRVFDVGFAHEDDLEAALERSIFFDVLAIFVERGGADGAQLAAGQRRLQHVGGVNRAFGRARAHQGVQLVDEQDGLALRVFNVLEDSFETIFKFAAKLRARQHRAQIERHHALVLQGLGHVAGDDALGQAFDDGGFAHAGLADQHRIVLGAAREHLHHAADFLVAADDRIELAAPRLFGQVAGITLQRLVLGFGILVRDFLRSAHRGQGLEDGIVGGALPGQNFLGGIALQVGDGQQQVLGRNILVLEIGGFLESALQQLVGRLGEADLRGSAAGNFRQALDLAVSLAEHSLRTNADFLQHGQNDALFVFEQRRQQVQRQQFRVAVLGGEVVASLHRFLRLHGEFFPTDCHRNSSETSN